MNTQNKHPILYFFAVFCFLIILNFGFQDALVLSKTQFCASDKKQQELFNAQPDIFLKHQKFENQLYLLQKSQSRSFSVADYTLPVVVHIIHNNGNENISDALVLQGMQDLNDAFANMNYYDQGTGVNTQIEFCLAKQDPDGIATTGINRVVSSFTNMNMDSDDLTIKDLIRWDPLEYINIWLVKEICSTGSGCGVAGYAYLPSAHGSNVDGIVMEAEYFGSSSSNSGVQIHEMGHYLGLYHTFQGGCSNNDCLENGDRVCDTPPDQSTAAVPCGADVNSCTTDTDSGFLTDQNDMYWNYMDYGDFNCYSAFTQGQADRMSFFIENTRSSLLDSKGCNDPCLSPISVDFTASGVLVNAGTAVTFTNNSNGGTNYDWQIDGVSFSNNTNSSYTFNSEGTFTITLIANNNDPNCENSFSVEIEVTCPVTASFISSSTEVSPGTTVFFNSTSANATSFEWYLDGLLSGTNNSFNFTFNNPGTFDIQLIASNSVCSDASAISVITVIVGGLAQTGLPVWPMTASGEPIIHSMDWRVNPPIPSTVSATVNLNTGQTGAAFDDCGNLVFYVVHTGNSDPDNLNIYAPDGLVLLDATTPNGPGLNAVRGGHEIQVIKVPELSNEWYILYNEWSTDYGAPLNNAAYNLAHQLYSRVKFLNGVLEVLERDIVLTASNGNAYLYNDGKAVSRTVNGDLNRHYLYACRRVAGDEDISIDRFFIDQNGITFDANTGNVVVGYWSLTGAGSPIELSPTEEIIAVANRNQSSNYDDFILFDAQDFNNTNIQIISAGDLILVPDGTSNDLSNELPYAGAVEDIADDNSINLAYLNNFEKKLSGIEFSPNGRFLYIVGGGYVGGSLTNITYLAQVDLEASPLEVRLQLQEPPFGNYSNNSGAGCNISDANCLENYNSIGQIESCYDGNLYIAKRTDNILYVIPDPNNILPQNLVPSDVDLSTPEEPNIVMNGAASLLPDQIDGFNYLQYDHLEVSFVVNKLDCDDNCEAPYILNISRDGNIVDTFHVSACPDTLTFCADTSLVYDLSESVSGIIFNGAISFAETNYPVGSDFFDFSENPNCEELCDNGIDDDNDGFVDCNDPDLANDCCCLTPPNLDLGPDVMMCENGVVTFDAGNQFAEFIWQDGSSEQIYTAWNPGTYWVTATDTCGNSQMDSISFSIDETTFLDLGNDIIICIGQQVPISASGYNLYSWTPSNTLNCIDCANVIATPTSTTSYILAATTANGCISVDTIIVEITNTLETSESIILCQGDTAIVFGNTVFESGAFIQNFITPGGCDSTHTITVELLPVPVFELFATDISCFGEGDGSLSVAVSDPNLQFSLDGINFQDSPSFENLSAGTYSVFVLDANICLHQLEVTLFEPSQIFLQLPEDVTINLGDWFAIDPTISISSSYNFNWVPSNSLNCTDCLQPVAQPFETTTYTFSILDENNCSQFDEITIIVEPYYPVYIPNVFTPNGDGVNDFFYILSDGEGLAFVKYFKVFDRWGELVFEGENFNPNNTDYGWDGTFRGKSMDNAVFVYMAEVEFLDGKKKVLKGDVTLVK